VTIDWEPKAGVTLIPATMWGGQPFIWFRSRNGGEVRITLSMNGWRQSLNDALSAVQAAKVDAELTADLVAVGKRAAAMYPLSHTEVVLEIGDPEPIVALPHPTVPDPTLPPGKQWIVLFTQNPGGATNLRKAVTAQYPQVQTVLTTPQGKDDQGRPLQNAPLWYAKIAPPTIPYAVLLKSGDSGAVAVRMGDVYVTEAQVLGWLAAKPIDRVTYVYEKDANPVPPGVAVALATINEGGEIIATEFEDDTVDGTGETPDQYKVALAAAKKEGVPALVIESDGEAIKVLKNPTTTEQVLEAIE